MFSTDEEEHLRDVEFVLQRLSEQLLFARLDKCTFLRNKLYFCGFIVGSAVIEPQQDKIVMRIKELMGEGVVLRGLLPKRA